MGWKLWAALAGIVICPAAAGAADKPPAAPVANNPPAANPADKPDVGAPAAWIKPLTPPALAGPPDTAALHVLLRDVQVSIHGDTIRTFSSGAIQVAKPEDYGDRITVTVY